MTNKLIRWLKQSRKLRAMLLVIILTCQPDGYKHRSLQIGCGLRTIRPTEHGQRILVDAYYEDGTTGGGELWLICRIVTPDDGGFVLL